MTVVPNQDPEFAEDNPDQPGLSVPLVPAQDDAASAGAPTPEQAGTIDAPEPPPLASSADRSGGGAVRDEASEVKDAVAQAGKGVAQSVGDQASKVTAEAGQQAKDLLSTMRSQLRGQASEQQHRAADALQSWARELGDMASRSEQPGTMTQLAHQASHKGADFADWLNARDPGDVLDEVKSFARRRPVTFLVACGIAGVVAGRLTRGAVGANSSIDSPGDGGAASGRGQAIASQSSMSEGGS